MAEIIEVTDSNFDEKIGSSQKPVLLDLWAPWCGPCRMMGEVIKELAGETDEVVFAKMNVDENQEIPAKLRVSSIPLLVLFKDGQAVAKNVGLVPKETLLEFINNNK